MFKQSRPSPEEEYRTTNKRRRVAAGDSRCNRPWSLTHQVPQATAWRLVHAPTSPTLQLPSRIDQDQVA